MLNSIYLNFSYLYKNILLLFIILNIFNTIHAQDKFDVRLKTIIFFNDLNPTNHIKSNYFNMINRLPKHTTRPIIKIKLLDNNTINLHRPNFSEFINIEREVNIKKRNFIQNAKNAMEIHFAYPKNLLFTSLKKANKTIYNIAQKYKGLIWDIETKEVFTAEEWGEKRVKRYSNANPLVESQIQINCFTKDSKLRAITLGMSKFGQPDILIKNYSVTNNQAVKNLIKILAQLLIEDIKVGKNIHLNTKKITNKDFIEKLLPLKENKEINIELPIAMGHWEEGFSQNFIIEILFNKIEGETLHQKQSKLLANIFGLEEDFIEIEYDSVIEMFKNKVKQEEELKKLDSHSIPSY